MIMTKKNVKSEAVKTVKPIANDNEKALCDFETALLTALKVGAIQAQAVNELIEKAGFNVPQAEHEAAKPVDEKIAAFEALQAFIVKPANVKALTDSLKGLWLEIEPDKTLDKQGTSFCNYFMTMKVKAGETVKKAELLAYVQKEYRTHYVNVGHYATWLRRLDVEGVPHVKGNGFFKVTA